MRRWRAAALAACFGGALVTPLGGRAVSQACAASAVHVAIVVDTGSGGSVSAVCVPAGARDNGAVLLAARASMLGTPQPRYGTSGLLCAIDGFPATGCGERQNGHYAYWSYWHGGNGAWNYATVGPASTRVDPGIVEGWRWQPDGSASPLDPPPRVAPVASAICKPVPPPAPPTTTAVTTGTTMRAPSAATATTVPPTGHAAASGNAPPSRYRTTSSPPVTGRNGAPAAAGTVKPRRGARVAGSTAPNASTTVSPSTIALVQGGIATAAHGSRSGGVPVGLLLGAVLVAALFTVGALAARRRRSTA